VVVEGDIAIKTVSGRNADPCTAQGCLWRKWTDGLVYIPYYIANQYCEWLPLLGSTGILSDHLRSFWDPFPSSLLGCYFRSHAAFGCTVNLLSEVA
jgi:hypothetical protein